jgi:hypothetical protein
MAYAALLPGLGGGSVRIVTHNSLRLVAQTERRAHNLRPDARTIAAHRVATCPHWLNTTEAGWALYDALRPHPSTEAKKDPW